jgi:outer membrane protein TolC
MRRSRFARQVKLSFSVLAIGALTACASVSLEQTLSRVNDDTRRLTQGQLSLAQTDAERQQRAQAASRWLAQPLGQSQAVQLALTNSHALQALLAQGWAESADAAQGGRIANPLFSFERMVAGDELELSRALSFGLLDVLTLPARTGLAEHRIAHSQLRLSAEVVDRVTQVRQAWVRAVAAQELLAYARQVFESAQASAELARRMQAVGNFNRLSRAREQAFYADAATRLATAQHQATANREDLVRLLGLDEAQAQALQLPARLPDLPQAPIEPQAVGSMASQSRLDIRLAHSALAGAAKAQGLNGLTSFTDLELSARRTTVFDNAAATRSVARSFEVAIRLPVFDWGDMQRDAWNARTLAAANQLEATVRAAGSHVRESYSAYRTALDVAKHYRDEVLPLRRVISEENLLRYNGMLIGVFELLADAREQVAAVMAAIEANQQFWLADAALQASLIGRPTTTALSAMSSAPSAGGAGH